MFTKPGQQCWELLRPFARSFMYLSCCIRRYCYKVTHLPVNKLKKIHLIISPPAPSPLFPPFELYCIVFDLMWRFKPVNAKHILISTVIACFEALFPFPDIKATSDLISSAYICPPESPLRRCICRGFISGSLRCIKNNINSSNVGLWYS